MGITGAGRRLSRRSAGPSRLGHHVRDRELQFDLDPAWWPSGHEVFVVQPRADPAELPGHKEVRPNGPRDPRTRGPSGRPASSLWAKAWPSTWRHSSWAPLLGALITESAAMTLLALPRAPTRETFRMGRGGPAQVCCSFLLVGGHSPTSARRPSGARAEATTTRGPSVRTLRVRLRARLSGAASSRWRRLPPSRFRRRPHAANPHLGA